MFCWRQLLAVVRVALGLKFAQQIGRVLFGSHRINVVIAPGIIYVEK